MDSERDQAAGISIQEAAARLGMSEKTIRRRIKAGEMEAYQLPTSQGFEWRVNLDSKPADHQPPQNGHLNGHAAQPPSKVVQFPSRPEATPEPPETRHNDGLIEALRLVEKLQQQNLELSGRVGFLQHENLTLKDKMLLLEAPRQPQGSVVTLPREEIPVETQIASVGQFDPVEHMPETKPWWKRWLALE